MIGDKIKNTLKNVDKRGFEIQTIIQSLSIKETILKQHGPRYHPRPPPTSLVGEAILLLHDLQNGVLEVKYGHNNFLQGWEVERAMKSNHR